LEEQKMRWKSSSILISFVVITISCNFALAKCLSADLNGDCFVDFEDFALMANQWPDGYDYNDLAGMASEWLVEGIPEDPNSLIWVYIDDPGVSGHEGFTGYMSKYETTNAQYCQFLNAALASGDVVVDSNYVRGADGSNSGVDYIGEAYYKFDGRGYTRDEITRGGASRINYSGGVFTVDSGFDDHPVTYISWYGSGAFCNYYGYRLPTEWEWQAVADHEGEFNYGCGPSINNSIANYSSSTHPDGTTVVGSFGTYGYGMCDLAGNVCEFTDSYVFDINVLRGGGWRLASVYCKVSERNHGGSYGAYDRGFRVVLDLN
jgi:hypothetical protein